VNTSVTLTFRIPAEGMTLVDRELEALREDLYRAVVVPAMFEAEYFGFRDVLRLRPAADGVPELVEVTERGGWKRFDFVVSQAVAESYRFAALVARVEEAGGAWARDFGGWLSFLLPPNSIWDPTRELEALGAAVAEDIEER
jgi:hypothetical protein